MRGKGLAIAIAASLLITTQTFAQGAAAEPTKPIKCFGVNSCKGKGQCGAKNANACAGQNSCKGKGWLYLSPDACKQQNGTVIK